MTVATILVTGAAGFVGGHLLPLLRDTFPAATIVPTTAAAPAADGWRTLDVTDAGAVAALVRTLRPDACIHLAALAAVPAASGDPDLAWRVNLHGTLALARAILGEAPGCRLVFASSSEVYGGSFRAGVPLDERAVLAPANTYAATKAAADLALGALVGEGLDAIRLRPFNHTGAGQSPSFVVAAFARQVALIEAGRQPPLLRAGALEPYRDFLDVGDVCRAYAGCVADRALAPGTVLNLASGTPRKVGDVLGALCALAGIEPTIETGATLVRRSDTPFAAGDATLARTLLGWKPTVPWTTTLQAVLDDWRRRIRDERR